MTRYLTLDDALYVITRHGFHIRDAGLLSSALARPASAPAGVDAYGSLEEKAAVLLETGARNHALLDGNKRIAWTLTVLFLWINGCRHTFDTDTAFQLVTGVAAGQINREQSAESIGRHLERRIP